MRLVKNNIDYPIKTDFENNQPRLLLLSVDVKDCSTAVTFDSYRTYKSIYYVCNQDLVEFRLLANHIRKHINEISKSNKNIDLEILSKSIIG